MFRSKVLRSRALHDTAQKMKFSIKDFFSKLRKPQETADLVTFTEEIFNGKLITTILKYRNTVYLVFNGVFCLLVKFYGEKVITQQVICKTKLQLFEVNLSYYF